jgi:hypothetical protein
VTPGWSAARALAGCLTCVSLAGCGLSVQSADLFLLTRTGAGRPLTLLVNDDGTIRCNGRRARPLPDQLLLRARDLADSLDMDAKRRLRIAPARASVYFYTVKLKDGTITFPDLAAASRQELAQTVLFVLQASPSCGVSG